MSIVNTETIESTESNFISLFANEANYIHAKLNFSKRGSCSDSSTTVASNYLKEDTYRDNYEEEVIEQVLDKAIEINEESSIEDECGEPIREQYLTIDFTPTDSVEDSDYNVQKGIDFWHFINEHTELHHLKVTPKIVFEGSEQTDAWSSTTSRIDTDTTNTTVKWMRKSELMKPAFVTKQTKTYCDASAKVSWIGYQRSDEKLKKADSKMMKNKRDVQRMVAEMEAWDIKHPKSNDPPGHPPVLNSANLVREGRYCRSDCIRNFNCTV